MELIRQPVFLLLATVSSGFIVFLAAVPYFGLGEDANMVKSSVLAVMLLSGLLGAVLSASSSLAHEIRSGTALAVLAKPVGRPQFLLAKYLGLAGALTVLSYINLLGVLLASRMAFDAYGSADQFALAVFFGCLILAYLLGGLSNYFLQRPFVADAVFFLVMLTTVAFVVINFFDQEGELQRFAAEVDWRVLPMGVMVLFALWVLAGIALASSTRWDTIPTLMICSGFFLLGLLSDYLFRGEAGEAMTWWGSVLYTVVPNWQLFWLADALEGKEELVGVWGYVGKTFLYVLGYLGATLAIALVMFEDRELT